MKATRLLALIASTTALTAALQAQSYDPAAPAQSGAGSSSSPAVSAPAPAGSTIAIQRVSKESVKDRLTAKDLIGAAVHDYAGEKIGTITDIDLQGTLPQELAQSFRQGEMSGDDAAASPDSPSGTMSATQPGMPQSGDNREPSSSSSADTVAVSTPPGGGAIVFISVGGLWGVGDDLVGVPAAQLSYDAAEERFQLATAKADVVALARQETEEYTAGSSSTYPGATSAAKQSFSDDASQVESALQSDAQTSAFASRLSVTMQDDKITLSGSVETEEQKEQAIDVARTATSKSVQDEITVGSR